MRLLRLTKEINAAPSSSPNVLETYLRTYSRVMTNAEDSRIKVMSAEIVISDRLGTAACPGPRVCCIVAYC